VETLVGPLWSGLLELTLDDILPKSRISTLMLLFRKFFNYNESTMFFETFANHLEQMSILKVICNVSELLNVSVGKRDWINELQVQYQHKLTFLSQSSSLLWTFLQLLSY